MPPFPLPSVEKEPESVGSFGERASDFAAACGVSLFPWQRHVMDGLFAVDAAGKWAATEFGLLVARQNGKGEILVAYSLAHLFLFPRADNKSKTIIYTAHEAKTAADGFARIRGVIESVPRLAERVAHIYTANGQEGIVLKKRKGQQRGDKIKFIARSKNSGRGFSADTLIQDEAQEESEAAHAALSYTQTSVPNRQEFFAGTVPEDGVNDGTVFEGVRDRGRSDKPSRTGWMEWSPAGSQDPLVAGELDFSDESNWLASNPSVNEIPGFDFDTIGEQLSRDTSPGAAIFGRERLSVWPDRPDVSDVANSDIDMAVWSDHEVDVWVSRRVVLAVVIGRGGGYSSIGGAQRLDDGTILVQHLATNPGTLWLTEKVKSLRSELSARLIVLDEKNAATITSDMTRAGLRYMSMNMSEVAAAFDMVVEYVNGGLVVHPPQEELTEAVAAAVPRVMNKSQNLKTWEQGDPMVPSSAVQAVTLAVWGLKKTEAVPGRESMARPQVLSSAVSGGSDSGVDVLTMQF